jgi:hypothetical protein
MGLLSRVMSIFAKPERNSVASPPMGGTLEPAPHAERRRAVGQIGHSDVSPPSPALLRLAQEKAAGAIADGAIAARWHSSKYYDRYGGSDHPERDLKVYAIRDSWAIQRGVVRAGPDGYLDEITAPCEETGCQCDLEFFYHLRDLPDAMVSDSGRSELAKVRATLIRTQKR